MTHWIKKHRALCSSALTGSCLLAAAALAEDATSHRDAMPGPGRRRPPPEAFAACESKSEGAACSVTFHGDTLTGTCVAPDESSLFCLPDRMPPPPGEHPGHPPG